VQLDKKQQKELDKLKEELRKNRDKVGVLFLSTV